ncbi:MAG TPA: ribonucleotide reductase N-terminal alpha domain-containing protein, partial [Burkholderiales bacterium]|nr:ribonucleotide reductase N-terminal alpha domain-containing protein [Burkholderiales bacterium]
MSQHSNISDRIWNAKYRWRDEGVCFDQSIEDTWHRIAHALAGVGQDSGHESEFYSILENFAFLPGGRIQAGAGTRHRVTLFNCF